MPNEFISRELSRQSILDSPYDCDTVNHFLGLVDDEPAVDVVQVAAVAVAIVEATMRNGGCA